MTPPPAFVLNMYATGLGIARNLGRHGIPVVGVSNRADAPGNYSRYCRALVGPDSQEQPQELLEFLLRLGRQQSARGILFPTRDADVLFVDRYREELERQFIIPQPEHDALDAVMNKARLAELAERHGVGTPRTISAGSREELERRRDEILFPAVVKPVYAAQLAELRRAVGRQKGARVTGFDELKQLCAPVFDQRREVLVQEWVHGPADQFFVLGVYFDRGSRCLGAFTVQKIVQYPPDFGLGCLVRTIDNGEVRSLGLSFLERIGFFGLAEVEFKRDQRTGQYRLIEINPRHWDQHAVGTACGVNVTHLAYQDLCGDVPPEIAVQRGHRAHWIRGRALLRSLKAGLRNGRPGIREALPAILPGRKVWSLWSWRDPMPALRRRKRQATFSSSV